MAIRISTNAGAVAANYHPGVTSTKLNAAWPGWPAARG